MEDEEDVCLKWDGSVLTKNVDDSCSALLLFVYVNKAKTDTRTRTVLIRTWK